MEVLADMILYGARDIYFAEGAIQKLCNGQRGGGGRRFCYISLCIFEGEGGIL